MTDGIEARRLAIDAVRRIDEEGAYANILVPSLLADSDLEPRDRNLVTELSYGATRMRRALDWLCDRFLATPPPPALRAALRVGAYQLVFTRVPAHAAVSTTVAAASKRNRGVVNAVLRRVAADLPPTWPNEGVRRSYPDWMVERLAADLGPRDAADMLDVMNTAPPVTERADGYIQDQASQWVAEAVDAGPATFVLDLCAAPGGKATALATTGATVVAADIRPSRVGLVAGNVRALGLDDVLVLVADATHAPFAAESFDRVLVDAPCSGLGVLRRRPDARWRIDARAVEALSALQSRMLEQAWTLVKPGGLLVYSVCTVTDAETIDVATRFAADHADAVPVALDGDRWRPLGTGGRVLPQDRDTDGMSLFRWRKDTATV